jgi:biopolymer transport protein ExbD
MNCSTLDLAIELRQYLEYLSVIVLVFVSLRGDASVDYGKVVQVMDMIKNMGIQKVYIATDTKG